MLAFIDTETTGLDPRIHQPYEVAWWMEDEANPESYWLEHTLDLADPAALAIGHYWDRGAHAAVRGGHAAIASDRWVANALHGVTLVGSNPSFDAAMLTRFIGTPVWHHRMIDVSNIAMVIFDTETPIGLAECASRSRDLGFTVPEPDHTAEGDVRTTRAVYEALRARRRAWGS